MKLYLILPIALLLCLLSFGKDAKKKDVSNKATASEESTKSTKSSKPENPANPEVPGESELLAAPLNIYYLDSLISVKLNSKDQIVEWLSKYTFEYDENGQNTIFDNYRFIQTSNTWKPYQTNEYKYDSAGNIVQRLIYEWADSLDQMLLVNKHSYTYDINNNLLMQLSSRWDFSKNQWNETLSVKYSYNKNNSVAKYSQAIWNSDNQLITRQKQIYSYNKEIHVTQTFNWDNDSKDWVNYTIDTQYYNMEGVFTGKLSYKWDKYLFWHKHQKAEYSYDKYGNLILSSIFQINKTLSGWDKLQQTEYKYDNEGNVLNKISCIWDKDSDKWLLKTNLEYTYDANTNVLSFASYSWNKSKSRWEGSTGTRMNYDLAIDKSDFIYPASLFSTDNTLIDDLVNMPLERTLYTIPAEDWIPNMRDYFYWSTDDDEVENPTDIEAFAAEYAQKQMLVFPNPATSIISFNFEFSSIVPARVIITDLQGKVILQQELPKNNILTISQLNEGLYIYRCIYGGKIYKGKFMKY